MNRGVAVNGRFRTRHVTGVERYAGEIADRIQPAARLVVPGRAGAGLRGHLWEQCILPLRLRPSERLWSPANSGPLSVHNQVLSLHDMSVFDHAEWFNPTYARWHRILLPRLVKSVKKIITMSDFSRDRIVQYFGLPPARVTCIPEGVDLGHFHPQPEVEIDRLRRKLDVRGEYVLLVATLEPRKNIDRLLQAWKRCSSSKVARTLVIAGGRRRVFREIEAKLGIGSVRWLGYVPECDLPALYSGACAYVLPSLYEGFGLSTLEAMACGTPVAAAKSGAIPEVVGESAVLFDPLSIESIAQALERVQHDRQLRDELIAGGFERAARFTWEAAAKETWSVLNGDWT